MTTRSHDDIELRIAEALTGEAPLDASLRDHLQGCASCTALGRALRALAEDARSAEPSPAAWRDFDRKLNARITAEPRRAAQITGAAAAPMAQGRSPWRIVLPLAAALGVLALALWLSRGPASGDPAVHVARSTAPEAAPGAAPASQDPLATVVAAASVDGLNAGLQALGITTDWDDDASESDPAPPDIAGPEATLAPVPAWDDVLGGLEDEFSELDPAAQSTLARALRVAS